MMWCVCVCSARSVAQLCLTLCDPMDCSLPGSSVHEIFHGKNTEVGCHFLLQGICLTQDQTSISRVSCFGRWILYHSATWEAGEHSTDIF